MALFFILLFLYSICVAGISTGAKIKNHDKRAATDRSSLSAAEVEGTAIGGTAEVVAVQTPTRLTAFRKLKRAKKRKQESPQIAGIDDSIGKKKLAKNKAGQRKKKDELTPADKNDTTEKKEEQMPKKKNDELKPKDKVDVKKKNKDKVGDKKKKDELVADEGDKGKKDNKPGFEKQDSPQIAGIDDNMGKKKLAENKAGQRKKNDEVTPVGKDDITKKKEEPMPKKKNDELKPKDKADEIKKKEDNVGDKKKKDAPVPDDGDKGGKDGKPGDQTQEDETELQIAGIDDNIGKKKEAENKAGQIKKKDELTPADKDDIKKKKEDPMPKKKNDELKPKDKADDKKEKEDKVGDKKKKDEPVPADGDKGKKDGKPGDKKLEEENELIQEHERSEWRLGGIKYLENLLELTEDEEKRAELIALIEEKIQRRNERKQRRKEAKEAAKEAANNLDATDAPILPDPDATDAPILPDPDLSFSMSVGPSGIHAGALPTHLLRRRREQLLNLW